MKNVLELEAALQFLADDDVQVLSGGTDYYPALNDATPASFLLNVQSLPELRSIELVGDDWRIGAGVTWSQLINMPMPECFNALKLAAREVGSVQIQNSATIVGNLCNASPAADGVPALLVLNARIELSSVNGVRVVDLSEFITGVRSTVLRSHELVTAILIPNALASDKTEFVKLGSRTYLVISIVMCAVRIRVDDAYRITDAAIAVGACSPVAKRLTELEQLLVGRTCDASLANCVSAEHLSNLSPIDDVRATAEYRLQATRVLLQRMINGFADHATTDASA